MTNIVTTGRQIFYRMVKAHSFGKTEASYKRLCDHLAKARRGRYIPSAAIRDDGKSTYNLGHFNDRDDFLHHIRELGEGYNRNKLAELYSVPVYSSGGFDSLTAKKRLADRICEIGKHAIVLHLGDFDPSGVSIFSAVAEDVAAFVRHDLTHGFTDVEFKRVCLTKEQVEAFQLPTAPPKVTDARTKSWTGGTCQLEALPPNMIVGLLRNKIEEFFDFEQLDEDIEAEEQEKILINNLLPAPE